MHRRVQKPGGRSSRYAIVYAESNDGLKWNAPDLGLFEWNGTKQNNVVIRGPNNARASGPQVLLTLPEEQKRGFTYVMTYRTGGAGKEHDGIRLIGSHDGVHWDADSEVRLKHVHSDTLNSIVYDAGRDRYLMTCHAKDRYRRFKGEMIDTFPGEAVRHKVTWNGDKTMAELEGKVVRLEIFLQDADLFTILAE